MTQVVRIDGMSCGHCAAKVKDALERLAGVESADVSFEENRATLSLSGSIEESAYRAAVDETGYTFVSVE